VEKIDNLWKHQIPTRPGANLINNLPKSFTSADPKSAKKTDSLTVFFELLGSVRVKAVCVKYW